MDERAMIENAYREMYRGMVEKDRELLNRVLGDSFVLIHMTGMHQPKEVFIRAVEDGTLNYFSAEHQQMDVDFSGESAVMTGKSLVTAAVFGGGRHTWRLQQDLRLERKADHTWKITESKASTY